MKDLKLELTNIEFLFFLNIQKMEVHLYLIAQKRWLVGTNKKEPTNMPALEELKLTKMEKNLMKISLNKEIELS